MWNSHRANELSLMKLIVVGLALVGCAPTTALAEVGAAAAAAKSAPAALSKVLDYRYFVAGGVCAATSHGITTPIDVVKTRMQAEPEVYNKGVRHAALEILKTDGPGVLLGGLGPTVVGYGVEGALKFGIYEVMKPVMLNLCGEDQMTVAYVAASVLAGAVASLVLCPMESTRIRIVTDADYADLGLLGGLPKLVREEGLLSTFSGIWAMLAKQVPYTMAKQVSFDVVARLLYDVLGSLLSSSKGDASYTTEDLKWLVSISAAFVASIFACIFSQPGDMVLTETYKGTSDKSFPQVVSDVYNKYGGLPGFFTGTGARILHVSSIITSQLVIYDIVKQLLGLPATGSH